MLTCPIHGTPMQDGACDTCQSDRRAAPRRYSHSCRYDAPGRHVVAAYCGTYIKRTEHANEPTCPVCREQAAALEKLQVR